MTPWFLATQPFLPAAGETWQRYIDWSGLTQLRELVSLDGMLCPPVLRDIKDEYWPYIVNESFMLNYFVDFDFLMAQLTNIRNKNVLCVFRNPTHQPEAPSFARFAFLGYDLTDREGSTSALTNCGGFPDIFANAELSPVGLLKDLDRAIEVQHNLRSKYPEERHADCHLWAIFRLVASPTEP